MDIKAENLDLSKVEVPDGYILIVDPEVAKQQCRQEEIRQLQEIINNTPTPTNEELIDIGKQWHPYYENLRRLAGM